MRLALQKFPELSCAPENSKCWNMRLTRTEKLKTNADAIDFLSFFLKHTNTYIRFRNTYMRSIGYDLREDNWIAQASRSTLHQYIAIHASGSLRRYRPNLLLWHARPSKQYHVLGMLVTAWNAGECLKN